ncbi:DUF4132 domain-containing protein [Dactylosporangium sp. NPDC005555]|uniref:DUF4132 domain-containing protein n=1 Tax=Dactylosporangium sp. NPDC005555 TaxID=3154889 RepID=UPI0033A5AC1D
MTGRPMAVPVVGGNVGSLGGGAGAFETGVPGVARLAVPASWRRSIHPRRGGVRIAYVPVGGAVPDRADTRGGLRLSPDGELAALADAEVATPLGAAAMAGILLWSRPAPHVDHRAVADDWIAGMGLEFAAVAGVELTGLRPLSVRCDKPSCAGRHTTVVRRGGEADAQNGTGDVEKVLAQIRVALAAASDDLHAAVIGALSELRDGGFARRFAASFLAPEQTTWVDADARDLAVDGRRHPHAPLLMAAAHTADQAALIRPQIHSTGWRLLRGVAMIHTLAEGLGDTVLDVYDGWRRWEWGTADEQRALMNTLAAIPTDRAFLGLLRALDVRGAQAVVESAAERFPERAMRLLSAAAAGLATAGPATAGPASSGSASSEPAVAGPAAAGSASTRLDSSETDSSETVSFEVGSSEVGSPGPAAREHSAKVAELLRRHVVRHPGLVPAATERPAGAPIEAADAAGGALPAVLVTPPWEGRRAATKPVVIADLRCTDGPVASWPAGERERIVAGLKTAVRREDPEQLASQLRAGSLDDWLAVDLFEAGPEELVRPLLATWNPQRLWGAHYWLPRIAARFGVAALPLVLRVARRSPADGGPALMPFEAPEVALLVAGWHGRLKAARVIALEWLRRHPAAAARVLVPAALARPGAARRHAEQALLALAAAGHRDAVIAAAAGHGAQVGTAIRHLLDTDPLDVLPARIPFVPAWADPATLPPVRVRGTGHVLPGDAARHLVTMLMVSKVDEPYAGIAIVRDTCELSDLARFAWALLQRWEAADAPPADSWTLDAQALLGDDETAARLAAAVRDWPYRGAHQRAAAGLDVLALLGTDAALTQLQDIATTVKAKAVKARAELKLREVAEALDLTPDQLADRLVPHLDLTADATLTLDYGPRRFVAGFDEQLKPFVVDAAGTRRKDLPAPSASDDPRLAPAARQRFAEVKKTARKVAGEQVQRLERAMIMGRRWSGAEFRRTFLQHPLLWPIARRLVWLVAPAIAPAVAGDVAGQSAVAEAAGGGVAGQSEVSGVVGGGVGGRGAVAGGGGGRSAGAGGDGGRSAVSGVAGGGVAGQSAVSGVAGGVGGRWDAGVAVRLAEDRSLADVDDAVVVLADDAVVSVAHPLWLDVRAWAEVFADYEILQPFRQLARDVHALREGELAATRLTRFDDRRALTVKLLGLERRGWRRAGQDGGYQARIERDLPAGQDLPGGGTLIVDLDPGIAMGTPAEHPEQSLTIWICPAGGDQWPRERTVPFSALDPVSASEVLRDLGACY